MAAEAQRPLRDLLFRRSGAESAETFLCRGGAEGSETFLFAAEPPRAQRRFLLAAEPQRAQSPFRWPQRCRERRALSIGRRGAESAEPLPLAAEVQRARRLCRWPRRRRERGDLSVGRGGARARRLSVGRGGAESAETVCLPRSRREPQRSFGWPRRCRESGGFFRLPRRRRDRTDSTTGRKAAEKRREVGDGCPRRHQPVSRHGNASCLSNVRPGSGSARFRDSCL